MNAYASHVVSYLLAQSWQIALLAGMVGLISLTLRNRSAHLRYLLWLIVLAKCLVPPFLTVPLAVLPERSASPSGCRGRPARGAFCDRSPPACRGRLTATHINPRDAEQPRVGCPWLDGGHVSLPALGRRPSDSIYRLAPPATQAAATRLAGIHPRLVFGLPVQEVAERLARWTESASPSYGACCAEASTCRLTSSA